MVAHGDVAMQTAGMCLVAVSYVSAGKFVEAFGQRPRFVHPADEQACCAQFGEHELIGKHALPGGHMLHQLFQQGQGLSRASGEGICSTQDRGGQGEENWKVGGLAEPQAAFEPGNGLLEHPLAAVEQPHPYQCNGHTVRVL